jgi:cytoskeleton protein RodZ
MLRRFSESAGEMKEIARDFEISEDGFPEKHASVELGGKLRAAREAKGLDYRDLTETTRLRPQFLEALENGDWNDLPSSALARGFIKTYARALGLDAANLMDHYEYALPTQESPLTKMVPERRGKRLAPSVLIAFFLVIGLGVAGFMLWGTSDDSRLSPETEPSGALIGQPGPLPSTGAREKIPKKPEVKAPADDIEEASTVPAAIETEPRVEVPPAVSDSAPQIVERVPEEPSIPERPSAPEGTAEALPDASSIEPSEGGSMETRPEVTEPVPLTLKAEVRERTWVRISVDGEEPREYIFAPGKEPEWQAHKKFDLLIGNAGGLNLELNGEKIGPLGASGQVVRVKLPRTTE